MPSSSTSSSTDTAGSPPASASAPTAAGQGHGQLCIVSVDAGGRATAAEELVDWAQPCTRGAVWCAFGENHFVAWREVHDPGELITPVDLSSALASRTLAVREADHRAAPPWVAAASAIARPADGWRMDGTPLPIGGLITLRVHALVMLVRLEHTPRTAVIDEILTGLLDTPPPGATHGSLRVAVLRGHEEHELLLWVRAACLGTLHALLTWLRGLPVPARLAYDDDLLRQLAPAAFGPGRDIGWSGLPVFEDAHLTVLMPLAWGAGVPAGGGRLLSIPDPRTPGAPPQIAAGPDLAIPVASDPLFVTMLVRFPPSAEATATALVAAWQALGRIPDRPPMAALRGGELALPVRRGGRTVRAADLLSVVQLTLGDADTVWPPEAHTGGLGGPGHRAGLSFELHLHLEAPAPAARPHGAGAARLADAFRVVVDRKRRACVREAHESGDETALLQLWTTESLHAGMPWAFRARVGHLIRRWADGLRADPERHAVALDVLRTLRDACLRHQGHRNRTGSSGPTLVLDGPVGQPPGPLHVDALLPIVESLECFLSAEVSTARRGPRPSPAGSSMPCGRRRGVEIIGAAVQVFGAQWGLDDHVVMVADSDDAILQAHPVGRRTLLVRLPRGATEDPLMLTLGPTLAFAWMERTPLREAVRRNPALQDAIDALLRASGARPALPDAGIRAILEAAQAALSSLQPSPVAQAVGWLLLRLPALRLGRRALRRPREAATPAARRRERLLHGPLVVRTCVDAVVRSGHRVQHAVEAGILTVLLSAELRRPPGGEAGRDGWRSRAHQTLRFCLDNPHFFDPDNAVHATPDAVETAVQPLVLDMLRALCEDLGVGPDVMAFAMGRLADDLCTDLWVAPASGAMPGHARIVEAWLQLIPQLDAVPPPTPPDHPLHTAFLDYLDACLPDPATPRAAGPWPQSVSSEGGEAGLRTRGFLVDRALDATEAAIRERRSRDGRRPICLLRSGGRLRPTGDDGPRAADEIADRDRLLNALSAKGGRALGAIFVDPGRAPR